MGRPKGRDINSRRGKAERKRAQRAADAAAKLAEWGQPNQRVLDRRETFAFVKAEKGGSIDQDIRDGIGQLHVLGLLDGHGHDALELRNVGREFAELYWERYAETAPKCGQFERASKSSGGPPPRTARYDRYDRLDDALPRASMERTAICGLLTNHFHSDSLEGWVQRLVDHELFKRGRLTPDRVLLLDSETHGHDLYMLGCALRGLLMLMDASLAPRFARRAA